MIYIRLFLEFFRAGLFAVGGGLATLPFLYDISDRTGWFTHAQLADMIAVSESTPGPIGVNMATYTGFLTAGVPGAIISTLGLVTPSIIIILIISAFLNAFSENKYVKGAFYGLRPASTALITAAGLAVAKIAFFSEGNFTPDAFQWKAVILAAALLIFTQAIKQTKGWHPIIWIGLSAVIGAVFGF